MVLFSPRQSLCFSLRDSYLIVNKNYSIQARPFLRSLSFFMFLAAPKFHDLTICLKCRYRIAMQQRLLPKRPHPFPLSSFVRSVSGFHTTTQLLEQLSLEGVPNFGNRRVFQISRPELSLRLGKRKVLLGMGSLGEPGEALLIDQDPFRDKKNQFQMKETTTEARGVDHSQMVDTIGAEKEQLNAERVSKSLEEIKATFFDSLSGSATASELQILASSLYKGFTAKQLRNYYKAGNQTTDYSDLLLQYSSPYYTRSSWRVGSTDFPDHASAGKNTLSPESDVHGKSQGATGVVKMDLVQKILKNQWLLISKEEMGSSGELDILILHQHLDLLLNHSKKAATV